MDKQLKNTIITTIGFIFFVISIFLALSGKSLGITFVLFITGLFLFIIGLVSLFKIEKFLLGASFMVLGLVGLVMAIGVSFREKNLAYPAILLALIFTIIISGILMLFQKEKKRKKIEKGFLKILIKSGIVPLIKESDLFLMSTTFFILLIVDPLFRKELFNFVWEEIWGVFFIAFILFYAGLPIYYAFAKKKIERKHKKNLYYFVIFINLFVGVSAGFYLIKQARGLLILFPAFNIFTACFLVFLLSLNIFEDYINLLFKEPLAEKWEIILGATFTFLIFFISHFIFKNYWAITFSMCVFYVTNLNGILRKIFQAIKG